MTVSELTRALTALPATLPVYWKSRDGKTWWFFCDAIAPETTYVEKIDRPGAAALEVNTVLDVLAFLPTLDPARVLTVKFRRSAKSLTFSAL